MWWQFSTRNLAIHYEELRRKWTQRITTGRNVELREINVKYKTKIMKTYPRSQSQITSATKFAYGKILRVKQTTPTRSNCKHIVRTNCKQCQQREYCNGNLYVSYLRVPFTMYSFTTAGFRPLQWVSFIRQDSNQFQLKL